MLVIRTTVRLDFRRIPCSLANKGVPKVQHSKYTSCFWAIYLEFADVSERNFEVGRLSRVGALENTKKV